MFAFKSKSLKRMSCDFICANLDQYPAPLLRELPNCLKTALLELILNKRIYSELLRETPCHLCRCQYCRSSVSASTARHLKQHVCALLNPSVNHITWSLEDIDDLDYLAHCTRLRSLELFLCKGCEVSAAGAANVCPGDTLEPDAMHARNDEFSLNDILPKKSPNLDISLMSVDGIHAPSMSKSRQARVSFARLFSALSHLTEFQLDVVNHETTSLITDSVVDALCASCPGLECLRLRNCEYLTNECMKGISCLHLRCLDLSANRLSDAAFTSIPASSPLLASLSQLKLNECLFLSNAIVEGFLVHCPGLAMVNCLGCPRLNNFDALFARKPIQIRFTFGF